MLEEYQVYTLRIIDEEYRPIDDEQKQKLIAKYAKNIASQKVVTEYRNGAYIVVDNHEVYYAAIALELPIINVVLETPVEKVITSIFKRLKKEVLNPMMSAFLYYELIEIAKMTQLQMAEELSRTQGSISNKLRLLKLPKYVQEKILSEEIKERHGRALLQLIKAEDYEMIASKLAYKIVKDGLKVVEVEDLVGGILGKKRKIRDALYITPVTDRTELKNPASGMIIEKINSEVNKTNDEITRLFPLLDIELVQGVNGEDYVFLLKLKGINNG